MKTSIKYFIRGENNMIPCLRRNKLSKKYIRDKLEVMIALFYEVKKWGQTMVLEDKLWFLPVASSALSIFYFNLAGFK